MRQLKTALNCHFKMPDLQSVTREHWLQLKVKVFGFLWQNIIASPKQAQSGQAKCQEVFKKSQMPCPYFTNPVFCECLIFEQSLGI